MENGGKKGKTKVIKLSPKQKELVMAAINERQMVQGRLNELTKKEGDMVAIVLDSNGVDNEKVGELKFNEDQTEIHVTLK